MGQGPFFVVGNDHKSSYYLVGFDPFGIPASLWHGLLLEVINFWMLLYTVPVLGSEEKGNVAANL